MKVPFQGNTGYIGIQPAWENLTLNISDLREKADSGSAVAQTILGTCYLAGTDVEVDYEEAFRLLWAASGQGASRATVNLAHMYAEGLGIPKNQSEAIWLYEAAAKSGEFLAQIELARIFAGGTNVPADPSAARSWYSAAIAQADRLAGCEEELREAKAYLAKSS